ncbi:MAG: fibronectin type III-like domain-contianing protein, partial [Promethearchaeota archaeon]
PGETKTCTLTLNTDNLAFFDAEKNKWIIEPSEYELLLGPSSKPQDLLKAKFNISN